MSLNFKNQLNNIFFTSVTSISSKSSLCWLGLSLILSLIPPIVALNNVAGQDYWIQDDARQHIFWMMKFVDPELFNNDLIANYYESISPLGVKFVYRCFSFFRIDPIFASKILPFLLSLATSFFAFYFSLQIISLPFTAFVASSLMQQNLWMQDSLTSATAKAFFIPIFLAFLTMLAKKSYIGVITSVLFLGLFYPTFVLVASGIIICQIFSIKDWRIQTNFNSKNNFLVLSGLITAFLVLLPKVLITNNFEPVISLEQARQLPEFVAGGRASFFHDHDPWRFWFNASRSGIRLPSALIPELSYFALLLPIILLFKNQFPLSKSLKNIALINQLIGVSFFLFFAAHILLFRLYLPSRYTQHGLRFAVIFSASVAITLLLHKLFLLFLGLFGNQVKTSIFLSPIFACLLFILTIYPFTDEDFPNKGYIRGNYPQLYDFIKQTPKETVIASVLGETDNIPSFTQHPVFVGAEYGIPYHIGYYRIFRQRVLNLIEAHYSNNLQELQSFIQQSGVDLWLVNDNVFIPEYLQNNKWLQHFQPQTNLAIETLEKKPEEIALKKVQDLCTVFSEKEMRLISSQCILKADSSS